MNLHIDKHVPVRGGLLLFTRSVVSVSLWLWTAARQASKAATISQNLLKLLSIELMMSSSHLILCHLLLLLPSVVPSMKVFSSEWALCIRWPKCWSINISPSNEYSGLISFRIDWFDLLAVQGTLKSLLQHYSLKTSILQHLAFFMVQLSYPYMTTGKIIALTRWTFVCKVMSVSLEGFIASHTAASPRIYSLNPYFPPLDGPCILKY